VILINSKLGKFIYKLSFESKENYMKNYLSELHALEKDIKDCESLELSDVLIKKLKRKCRLLERINLINFSKYEHLLIKHNKFISKKRDIILDIALNIDRPDNLF
jgi:TFIIF-interacting CTD phosphatase-like protein